MKKIFYCAIALILCSGKDAKLDPGKGKNLHVPEPSDICTASDGGYYVVSDNGILFKLNSEYKIEKEASFNGFDFEGVYADDSLVYVSDESLSLNGTYNYVATVTNSFGCTATVSVPVTVASCASGITLTTKMFIEGYSAGSRDNYGSTGGFMDNGGGGGLLYLMGMSANPSDVDYVTVSLMDAVDYSEVATASGTLQADGMLIVQFPSASPGNYYIKLTHRNSIETWSAAAVTMTSTASYDFSSDVTQAFGDNMTEVSTGVWAIYSGDISDANNLGLGLGFQDGVVESQDYADMEAANAVNSGGYIPEDITGDGVVESTDYAIIEGNNSVNRGLQRPY